MAKNEKYNDALISILDHLAERNATLFLGAGINYGLVDSSGNKFPLGDELSLMICRDLLGDDKLELTLDEAAEIARHRVGPKALNEYVYDSFNKFKPGTAHLSLIQLPWDIIYTTNYDLLVEEATKSETLTPSGNIKPVFSLNDDLSKFTEDDILYYKLHGSIDYANTSEGRLILTKEDYKHYEIYRKPLFKRLERDLLSRTFVFVGYSLRDPNFRDILNSCRDELGTKTFPLSYGIRKNYGEVEETFWREKYNIQLIDSDSSEFLNALKERWLDEKREVIDLHERHSIKYIAIDQSTRFQKLGESFYKILPSDCTGKSNPKLFFQGAEPTWADIRDKIAPYRKVYWTLLDSLFTDLTDPSLPASLYLITGHAGTGKTTLARAIAFDVANEFNASVLSYIPNTPLDVNLLGSLVDEKEMKRIVILIQRAANYINEIEIFYREIQRKKLPVSIILEERKNQWLVASHDFTKELMPAEFEVGYLESQEIKEILLALEKYNCQGKLTGTPKSYQESHFASLAKKELLVALRELTTVGSFDDIVKDEFESIPSEIAKKVYVYVSALGQINVSLRYETIMRILDIKPDQLGKDIFRPADGILISGEASGRSRHNIGFNLSTRHPIIASIIFGSVASDDRKKFKIINEIITNLDPGFIEDKRTLEHIIRRKEIVNTLESADNRRSIFERLENILPGNPYVLQHRSILERDLNNPELAIKYAREAVSIYKDNPTFQNTLGIALELGARHAKEELLRQAYISEAKKLFDESYKKNPSDPYPYIGKVQLIKHDLLYETDETKQALLKAKALSLLEDAFEATDESHIIANVLADFRRQLGDPDEAIKIINTALEIAPTDIRLRDLLIRIRIDKEEFDEALETALAGAKYDPTSWRLQRHIARLMIKKQAPVESIKGHYEAALRHNRGNISLMVEFGAFLFIEGQRPEANDIFSKSKGLPIPAHTKRIIRQWWKDNGGDKVIFSGKVKSIRGAYAFALAVPENFKAIYWRTNNELSQLKEDDDIKFKVGFNAHGPQAFIII